MKDRRISEAVIRRLPKYYRQLELLEANEVERISSSELAQQMNLNASQVRQDLNCFGGFGQQGYGYHVKSLYREIAKILGITRTYKIVIAGAGNIGHALSNYEGFKQKGFEVIALFDINEELAGTDINGTPIFHSSEMARFIQENEVDIGVIAARRRVSQEIADEMVSAGVKGIWNFVPTTVTAPVPVENVQLSESLFVLSYRINEQ